MSRRCEFAWFFLGALALLLFAAIPANAQGQSGRHSRALIGQNVDEGKLVTLKGNTRPEAKAENDRGPVADDFRMEHMLLQLQRPPELEKQLEHFIDELHNPDSPNLHKWITAQQFGEAFGLAQQDVDSITRWLESHGFTVNVVYPSGVVIDFSGTAAQVREAFHTEMRRLEIKGLAHIANLRDPQIPAALAPAVRGIISLHDFRPYAMHKMRQPRSQFTFPDPFGGTAYAVVPADLATIYNLNPLFSAGTSGQGQTIVVIEDTDVFSASDWSTFRSALGLSGYTSGSFTTVYPPPASGSNNCRRPGVIAPNDGEAILDAEWASAAAPSAAIVMATCADTSTFGGLIAIQNLINGSNPPAIISLSFQECEAGLGPAGNAAFNAIYQQGVAEGTSIFVASGDNDAAVCDDRTQPSTFGIAVNGLGSTSYNFSVGGTDFSDTSSGTNSTYWNSANTATFGSAKSYIPEIPWNNTWGSTVLATFLGFTTTYGSTGLCNSTTAQNDGLLTVVGGSGGPSTQYSKPSYQNGFLGNPADGVRDLPDVSLFAGSGIWKHFYIFCLSDSTSGGRGCSGNPNGWNGAGGTSFAAPIWAGIQALINKNAGGRQGNPNVRLYQLAAIAYGASGSSACNSSNGNTVGSSCIFYDVTQGDNDAPCTGANCYKPSGTFGVLSTSTTSYAPAYRAQTGWDFATGIR